MKIRATVSAAVQFYIARERERERKIKQEATELEMITIFVNFLKNKIC